MIHLPRTAYHVGRGLWQARQAAGAAGPPVAAAALGLSVPHVYAGRVGLLDTDVNGHLNNAAYLVNCEMARKCVGSRTRIAAKNWSSGTPWGAVRQPASPSQHDLSLYLISGP